jgi:hypothetical protein
VRGPTRSARIVVPEPQKVGATAATAAGFLYSAAFHLLLGRVYDDKDVQERIVRRSKLDWVIVRPVILTNGPKTNAYRALVDPT